jgi:hypothetical protein
VLGAPLFCLIFARAFASSQVLQAASVGLLFVALKKEVFFYYN